MADSNIIVPTENPNDPHVQVVEWNVDNGAQVRTGQAVVTVENTKTAFEIATDVPGYLFHLFAVGDYVAVGDPIAIVRSENEPVSREPAVTRDESSGPVVTNKAKILLERHAIDARDLAGDGEVVRAQDVEEWLARNAQDDRTPPDRRRYGDEWLEPNGDWDRFLDHPMSDSLRNLRQRMMARFDRHIPTGSLLNDRWELALKLGFGEGSSLYDECLVLGDVRVGKHCWIGPFTILDGANARLTIGDYTSIGAGSHVYTHHTIHRALTGGRGKAAGLATNIGACCFIAPLAIIAPGTEIGDHSFVASHSYVDGRFPSHSYVAGNPARRIGRVEIRGDQALLIADATDGDQSTR